MVEEKKHGGWFLKTVIAVEFLIVAAMLFHFVVPARVEGSSMEPTLSSGRCLLATVGVPKHGDIILVEADGQVLVKRCIGVSGDSITYSDGSVLVNGEVVDEPYITDGVHDYADAWSGDVPEDAVFVMGDNRDNSLDSRILGCIDLDDVIGVVRIVLPEWVKF